MLALCSCQAWAKLTPPQCQTTTSQANHRKRKHQPEVDDELHSTQTRKKLQAEHATEKTDPVDYWTKNGYWPTNLFEQDDAARAYPTRDLGKESCIGDKEDMARQSANEPLRKEGLELMNALLPRPKPPSLRRNQSSLASLAQATTTPSDQKPREIKTAEYRDSRYERELAKKGDSFMDEDQEGPKEESKNECTRLLDAHQETPKDSRFSDRIFKSTCQRVRNRNESKVIDKIARLIVPSVEDLADFGGEHLKKLVETINQGWENSIPVTKSRPQPDYAVGFDRSAFTDEQLKRFEPWVGELTETSFFMATDFMYFPFFTCEVKCGAAALDIADRQNAHSMTVAVRGIVALYRLVKHEKELDREILAFSVSHDHGSVRIYGHYPVINGQDTKYYRYRIREFNFTERDGREKWATYKFTKNIFDHWMPCHLKRILFAIENIPLDINFGLSQSASFSQGTLIQASQGSVATLEEGDGQRSFVDSQDVTPNTSFTDQPSKKPKNKRAAE